MKGGKYMYKIVPVIVGLFLGIIPIISHHMPDTVARFSGMTIMASPIGYILSTFVISWIYKESWKRSFYASFSTMATAFLAFYLSVHPLQALFYQIRFGTDNRILFWKIQFPPQTAPETIFSSLLSFVLWTALSVVVCAIAATIVSKGNGK